jgi:hypothetical protein
MLTVAVRAWEVPPLNFSRAFHRCRWQVRRSRCYSAGYGLGTDLGTEPLESLPKITPSGYPSQVLGPSWRPSEFIGNYLGGGGSRLLLKIIFRQII